MNYFNSFPSLDRTANHGRRKDSQNTQLHFFIRIFLSEASLRSKRFRNKERPRIGISDALPTRKMGREPKIPFVFCPFLAENFHVNIFRL